LGPVRPDSSQVQIEESKLYHYIELAIFTTQSNRPGVEQAIGGGDWDAKGQK